MAEKDLFSRLKRLFSTNTIVRNIGGRKLRPTIPTAASFRTI